MGVKVVVMFTSGAKQSLSGGDTTLALPARASVAHDPYGAQS